MQKKFLSNLLLLLTVNLIIKPLTIFGVDTEVQNRMGTVDFGLYFTLFNFSNLFNIVLDLGINNFTTRFVAKSPNVITKYLGSTLLLKGILCVVYIIFMLVVALMLGYKPSMLPLILLFGFQQICFTFISFTRSYFSGLLLFKKDAFLSVIDKVLILISCGTLLYAGFDYSFTIENYIGIQLACNVLAVIIALFLMLRHAGKIKLKFNYPLFIVIIRESLPFALFIVLMMLYTRLDSVMIERIHTNGSYESGVYAQGFRLVDAGFMFAMIFGGLLLPIFAKIQNSRIESIDLLKSSAKLLIWGAIGVTSFVFTFSDEILHLIYVDVSPNGSFLLKVQFLTFIVMCASVIYGTFLTAHKKMRSLNIIGALGLFVNLTVNFLLIPKHGALGAAIATVSTQGIVTISQAIIVYRTLQIKGEVKPFVLFLVYLLALFLGGYFAQEYASGVWVMPVYILLLMFVFKIIDLKPIFSKLES